MNEFIEEIGITYRLVEDDDAPEPGNSIRNYVMFHHPTGDSFRRRIEITNYDRGDIYRLIDHWNSQPKSGWQYATDMILPKPNPRSGDEVLKGSGGRGSIHLCWNLKGRATGRRVTMEDAQAYLECDDADHLREKGWRVVSIYGDPQLVANVKRVSETQLSINGEVYTYSVDPRFVSSDDGNVHDAGLTLTFESSVGTMEVKNWNIRGQICHFLQYEALLTDVHPSSPEGPV